MPEIGYDQLLEQTESSGDSAEDNSQVPHRIHQDSRRERAIMFRSPLDRLSWRIRSSIDRIREYLLGIVRADPEREARWQSNLL